MIKHIVTFKLRGTDEERYQVAQRFAEALLALPAQIDVLQSMEVGLNINSAEDWDIVLTAVVPSLVDVQTYSTHPAHVAAASLIKECKVCRACVDYEV